MKFYSEILDKKFDTAEECNKAEAAFKSEQENKAKEIDDLEKAYLADRKAYTTALTKLCDARAAVVMAEKRLQSSAKKYNEAKNSNSKPAGTFNPDDVCLYWSFFR